jgi:hypothetical protein
MNILKLNSGKVEVRKDSGTLIRTIGNGDAVFADFNAVQTHVLTTTNKGKVEVRKESGTLERTIGNGDATSARWMGNDVAITTNMEAPTALPILGLEPRDSNSKFNIERQGNFVFGSPFGIEQWSPKDKYYKSFKEIFNVNDCFIYFTDVVKEYEVKNTKSEADKNARKTFWNKAASTENIAFLSAGFQIIKPTHIIALGSETYKFLNVHFGEKVFKVTHPNARQNKLTKENAWDAINRQLQLIFENELPK